MGAGKDDLIKPEVKHSQYVHREEKSQQKIASSTGNVRKTIAN